MGIPGGVKVTHSGDGEKCGTKLPAVASYMTTTPGEAEGPGWQRRGFLYAQCNRFGCGENKNPAEHLRTIPGVGRPDRSCCLPNSKERVVPDTSLVKGQAPHPRRVDFL